MHPLNSVKGAIVTGFVLAIIVSIGLTCWNGLGAAFHPVRLDRWLHILSGVMWIGLLYYFNVVQTPGLAAAAADKGGPGGAGVSKYIAPRALLWFRWSAVATWATGVVYLIGGFRLLVCDHESLHAATGISNHRRRRMARHDHAAQCVGFHLAEPKENPRDRGSDG
jgi:hypothetical protein